MCSDITDALCDSVELKWKDFGSLSANNKSNALMSNEDTEYYTVIAVYKMFNGRKFLYSWQSRNYHKCNVFM